MKDTILYMLLLVALLAAGCKGKEKEAREKLEYAKELYARNEWDAAKNEIDSIRAHYPKQVEVLRGALTLMRQVEMKEAERNIAYFDSLLPIRREEAGVISRGFILDKDTHYQEVGNYIRQQQTIERNIERSYLRCGVSEEGEIYLASVYFGGRPINHTGIRVSAKDGLFAETVSIPYDGGLNYRFTDLGNTSEIVNYKGENGIDAIKFIYTNAKTRIKVDYTGGKPFSIYLEEADKKAIIDTYGLAVVLHDIETMTTEREKAIKKKAYLDGKLSD